MCGASLDWACVGGGSRHVWCVRERQRWRARNKAKLACVSAWEWEGNVTIARGSRCASVGLAFWAVVGVGARFLARAKTLVFLSELASPRHASKVLSMQQLDNSSDHLCTHYPFADPSATAVSELTDALRDALDPRLS